MAIITKETPVGYSLPEIARQFSIDMCHAGGAKTLHNDQAAAEIEGLSGPIAVGPQVAALIFRMMRLSFFHFDSHAIVRDIESNIKSTEIRGNVLQIPTPPTPATPR